MSIATQPPNIGGHTCAREDIARFLRKPEGTGRRKSKYLVSERGFGRQSWTSARLGA